MELRLVPLPALVVPVTVLVPIPALVPTGLKFEVLEPEFGAVLGPVLEPVEFEAVLGPMLGPVLEPVEFEAVLGPGVGPVLGPGVGPVLGPGVVQALGISWVPPAAGWITPLIGCPSGLM